MLFPIPILCCSLLFEDVMRVQRAETFHARLASPLLPFYVSQRICDALLSGSVQVSYTEGFSPFMEW